MRRTPVIVILAVSSSLAWSADITTDTLWSGDVLVTESVTVLDGVTLTIAPGTTVSLAGDVILRVEGNIFADGTDTSPILFTRIGHHSGSGRWGKVRDRKSVV